MEAGKTVPICSVPTHPELSAALEPYRGRRAYFIPLAGNHGDALIELGSRHLMAAFELKLVDDRRDADLIVINGGAKLEDETLSMLGPSSQRYPDTPLLVMPSTYRIRGQEFARCFEGRRSPAMVFARERYSFEAIRSVHYGTEVICRLDHDAAFALQDAPLIRDLRARCEERHVLVVERFDPECATVAPRQVPDFIKRWIPDFIARPLKKWRHRRHTRRSGFEDTVLARVLQEHPSFKGLPVISQDVSRKDLFSFEQFLELVAQAAVVITTRMHVGILGMMLGKPTYLKKGSEQYRKIQGVYEYSMAQSPHVKLI